MKTLALVLLGVVAVCEPHQAFAGQGNDVSTRRQKMRSVASQIDHVTAQVVQAIEAGLNDDDSQVRFIAASALSQSMMRAGVNRNADALKATLVARFNNETEPWVRVEIIQALAPFPLNADRQQILVRALTDNSTVVRKRAAIEMSKVHFQAALSIIADELRSGNEETRPEFVLALQSYGKDAKPYRSILVNLLPTEIRPDIHRQIDSALRAIDTAN